jgi:hypothetical protein
MCRMPFTRSVAATRRVEPLSSTGVDGCLARTNGRIWHEIGTEQGLPQCALQTGVELVNRFQEGKVRFPGKPLQAGLLAMRHFLGQQQHQKIAAGPVLFLRSIRDPW